MALRTLLPRDVENASPLEHEFFREVADGAGDVIQAAVYAIRFGLTTDQVAATWSPYLTFAEGFKLAAQTFKRDVSKLSCCAAWRRKSWSHQATPRP